MNSVQFQASRMASRCLPRRGPARISRRAAPVSLLAALAVAALGAATAAPAMASPAPSMTTSQNRVIISARSSHNGLQFYWAKNGTSTWHPEQVAPPGSVA